MKKQRKKKIIELDEVVLKREATLIELIHKLNMTKVIVFFN